MKTTRKVLALLLTMLMVIGSAAVAANAAFDLQAAIDSATEGKTVTLPSDLKASVVIDKDLTLDLGGHELVGVDGEHAIVVKNADVTVRNGHVYSKFENVSSVTLAEMAVDESPSAIRVIGGSLTAEGLRVVGSFARIPTTSKYYLPTGSAIEAIDGAEVTVIQSSLVGRYGVNNKVNHSTPGGTVTIEDGILMAFMRGVKDMSKFKLADGTDDVNAADRLEGFLNSGIRLEAREKQLMQTVFADRLHIYTKIVNDDALVEAVSCDGKAVAKAAVDDSRVWENNTSTDASYKYVPEYVVADGKLIPMTAGDDGSYTAELTAEQAQSNLQIKYRLQFVLQPDIQKYAGNFNAYLENLYEKVVKTINEVYDYAMDKYTAYMDALHAVDDKMMVIEDPRLAEELNAMPEFAQLKEKMFKLGGAVMATWGESWYSVGDKLPESYAQAYTGDQNYVLEVRGGKYIYGVLDRVALLKSELDAYMPLNGSDQSRWPEMVKWAYDNYEEVLSLLDDGETAILDLKRALNDFGMEKLLRAVPQAQAQAAKLDRALAYIDTLQEGRDLVLASHTVQTMLQKLEASENEIIPYTQKFISMYNNHTRYFTPSKFLTERGTVAKAYAVYGIPEISDEEVDHVWVEERRIAPTMTEPGKIIYVCDVCGEHTEEMIPCLTATVLWAGYEKDVVDSKLLNSFDPFCMYVVAIKGEADGTPMKVQIRSSDGTMTFVRNHSAVKAIQAITYDNKACELWTINRGLALSDDTYTAVAKYSNARGFADIEDAEGYAFTVVNPKPVYDNTVYSAKIEVIGADGTITFDGVTKQTVTIVTGADATKVQLRNDANDATMTYNENNAAVAEGTLEDETPVLIWTIERLFAANTYNFSIYTRSPLGLLDSGEDLQFEVKAADTEPGSDEKLLEVSAVVNADNSVVFTAKTIAAATKVKFTNTGDNGTMTFTRDNPRASVTENADGTLTWTITIQHVPSGKTNYNVQALVRTYSDPLPLEITVPKAA